MSDFTFDKMNTKEAEQIIDKEYLKLKSIICQYSVRNQCKILSHLVEVWSCFNMSHSGLEEIRKNKILSKICQWF